MRDGYIEQQGTPSEVFENPVNTFVATFIGSPPMNLLHGRVGKTGLEFADGFTLPTPREFSDLAVGREIILGFRADNMMPQGHAFEMDEPSPPIEMPVVVSEPLGTETLLYTRLAGQEVQAKMLKPRPVADGECLTFHLDLARCHLFDAGTQQSLR